MSNTTINIIDSDTLANLTANEPYSADQYHQLVYATDTSAVHRILDDGTLSLNIDLNGVYSGGTGIIPDSSAAVWAAYPGQNVGTSFLLFGIPNSEGFFQNGWGSAGNAGAGVSLMHSVGPTGDTNDASLRLSTLPSQVILNSDEIIWSAAGITMGFDFNTIGSPKWVFNNNNQLDLPNSFPSSDSMVWVTGIDGSADWALLPTVPAAQDLNLNGTVDPTLQISGGGANIDLQGTDGVIVENQGGNLNIGLELSTATATGDAVEYDQWISGGTNVFVDYLSGTNTYTPTTTFGLTTIKISKNVGVTSIGAPAYTGQIIRIVYGHLSNTDADPKLVDWLSGTNGQYIHAGEIIELRGVGTSWFVTRILQPKYTNTYPVNVSTNTANINPGLGETYVIDAGAASASITITIGNDPTDTTTKTLTANNTLMEKDYFYIKILNADIHPVSLNVSNTAGIGKLLYYTNPGGTLTETVSTGGISILTFVKKNSTGPLAGYDIY